MAGEMEVMVARMTRRWKDFRQISRFTSAAPAPRQAAGGNMSFRIPTPVFGRSVSAKTSQNRKEAES
jgi:hypothetical protein